HRAPELEIFSREITIGDGDAYECLMRACVARVLGGSESLIEPPQRSRADPQHQLIDIRHEVVHRAIGTADLVREVPRLQASQPLLGDHALCRKDERITKFISSFQGFSHSLTKFVSVAQIILERRSSYATKRP